MTKTILFLGGGKNQLGYIYAAKRRGYKSIVVDGDPLSPGIKVADTPLCCKISSVDKVLKLIANYKFHACISEQTDSALLTVGAINTKYNLLGLQLDVAKKIRDKYLQRLENSKFSISQPKFWSNVSKIGVEGGTSDVCEYILKPRVGQSSIGVKKFKSAKTLQKENAKVGGKDKIVEYFINGDDVSVDGFLIGNAPCFTVFAKKTKYDAGSFVDRVLECHADVPINVKSLCLSLLEKYNLSDVFFHIELKVTSNGEVYLIEFTARGGGSQLSSVIPNLLYGVDVYSARLELALGKLEFDPTSLVQTQKISAAMIFCTANDLKKYIEELSDKKILALIVNRIKDGNSQIIQNGTDRECCLYLSYDTNQTEVIRKIFINGVSNV